MKLFTDRNHLTSSQYADSSKLDARIALHQRFSTNPENFHRWYFDRLSIPGRASVLELGAGSGAFWKANAGRIPQGWETTLTDLSPGMLESAQASLRNVPRAFTYRVADIQEIPFSDNSFDAIIANHMLYHVRDRPRALAEVRRVLRPGGRFYAATNGEGHLVEIRQMLRDAGASVPLEGGGQSFSLENGAEQLASHFAHVQVSVFHSDLLVTEAEALIAFVHSLRDVYSLSDEHVTSVDRRIEADMERDGSIFIRKSTGFLEGW